MHPIASGEDYLHQPGMKQKRTACDSSGLPKFIQPAISLHGEFMVNSLLRLKLRKSQHTNCFWFPHRAVLMVSIVSYSFFVWSRWWHKARSTTDPYRDLTLCFWRLYHVEGVILGEMWRNANKHLFFAKAVWAYVKWNATYQACFCIHLATAHHWTIRVVCKTESYCCQLSTLRKNMGGILACIAALYSRHRCGPLLECVNFSFLLFLSQVLQI